MKKLSFLLSLSAILLLSSCCAFGTKNDKSEPANDSTANVTKAAIEVEQIASDLGDFMVYHLG